MIKPSRCNCRNAALDPPLSSRSNYSRTLGAILQAAKDVRDGVQCAAKVDAAKGQYVIEVALPLKTAQYDYTGERRFSFSIMRQVYYADTYSPAERLGRYPLFLTAYNRESRGMVFVE